MNLIIRQAVPQPQFEDTVNSILGRSEYKHLNNVFIDFIESAKEAIGKWIFQSLKKGFSNLENASSIADKLSIIFLIIGIVIFIALMGLILMKFDRFFEKRRRVEEILGEKIDSKTTPYTLKNKANSFAQIGDFRFGIRYSFIGLLLLMHERNLLYLDETKTNQEIYTFLKNSKFNNLEEFKFLIDMFNSTWYGHKTVDENSFKDWARTTETLWNEVMKYEEKHK